MCNGVTFIVKLKINLLLVFLYEFYETFQNRHPLEHLTTAAPVNSINKWLKLHFILYCVSVLIQYTNH